MDHYKERAGDDVDFTIKWKPFRCVVLFAGSDPICRTFKD